MSPKSMPPATSAIPPRTSKRRALMGAKVEWISGDLVTVAMNVSQLPLVRGGRVLGFLERGHHVLREHVLRLNALPVLDASEVRDDCQFADPSFGLQVLHLLDHFVRSAD